MKSAMELESPVSQTLKFLEIAKILQKNVSSSNCGCCRFGGQLIKGPVNGLSIKVNQ